MFSSSHPSSHSRKKRARTVPETPGRLGAPAAAPAPAFHRAISFAQNILDESFMRGVFNRHVDSNSKRELSSLALIAALKEAGAPLVLSSSFCDDDIFRRADANLSGAVDFEEFLRAARLPDELQMLLEDDHLAIFAPALRAYFTGSDNAVVSFADLSKEEVCAAVDASVNFMKQRLLLTHRKVKSAMRAKAKFLANNHKAPNKKFSIREMSTGSIDDFHEGLHDRIGSPNLDFLKAMRAEHMTKGGCDHVFVSGNFKLRSQARLEWLYVAGDENGKRLKPPASDMENGRIIHPIDELLQKPMAKAAKLSLEEMIAIVMYSGPAFVIYNAVLRQYPADVYDAFKNSGNFFPTTIFVLVSAVNKLSRCANIPADTLLYRGLGGTLEFPERFTRPDPGCKTPNALGFLEYGFMSTTADKNIAVQYSGVEEGKPKACILQIRPNSVDRGADISEFSQYPAEKEYLFVPYSFVQGEGRQRAEVTAGGGVLTVVPVHVNINLKTETVDELKAKKKRLHLASAGAVLEEVRYELEQWAASSEASARLQQDPTCNQGGIFTPATLVAKIVEQCDAVLKRHQTTGVEEFVDDGVFRALVSEVLQTKAWAKEKKELWMRDSSQYIYILQGHSLRNCHRLWQSFLRQSMSVAGGVLQDGESASILLLKSRGLVKRGVKQEENADGESAMVQAGADGWNMNDICAAAAAGADVCATDRDGLSGIFHAARYGHLDSLTALLKAGGDVHRGRNDGASPIWIAARNGYASVIAQLVSCGGDVNKCDDDGTSPIYVAATHGHSAVIHQLLLCGGDVNRYRNDGASPIYVAAYSGYAAVVQQLLAARADPRSSWKGISALDKARQKGHMECVRLLEAAMQ